jgi:hypothetical protein
MRTNELELPQTDESTQLEQGPETYVPQTIALVGEQTVGRIRNRLQAIVNFVYLLGTSESVTAENRVIVTHLQAEVAVLQRLLAELDFCACDKK